MPIYPSCQTFIPKKEEKNNNKISEDWISLQNMYYIQAQPLLSFALCCNPDDVDVDVLLLRRVRKGAFVGYGVHFVLTHGVQILLEKVSGAKKAIRGRVITKRSASRPVCRKCWLAIAPRK